MTNKSKTLMIAAGGTGGHIFPGLAIAEHLIKDGWQIRWLGTRDHMEAILVPKHNIHIDFIRIYGLRGKKIKELLLAPIDILRATLQARCIIKRWKPNIILGMGGYVSGPSVLASWHCGIPIILHEQNSVAGITNRIASKLANKVLQAFPGSLPGAEVVGNPVRMEILLLPSPEIRFMNRTGPIRVLVIGGSQGSHILNTVLPAVVMKMSGKLLLWHQVGRGHLKIVKQSYELIDNKNEHKIVEFIDNIADAYAWADVIICRSGALTVCEISIVGLPAIFVPFMHTDRQQYWNALPLEKIGAATIIEQPLFNADIISKILSIWNRSALLTMAMRARTIAMPNSTNCIAKEITSLLC